MPNPNWYPNKALSQDLVNRIILDNLYALRDSSKAVVAPATIPATAAASAGSGVSGGGSVSVITEATEDTFFPLQTPLLVNGVSGGNLGTPGNTYVAGRWMMS